MVNRYEQKTREIKRSLNRRARIRRNYFKLIGEDPKNKPQKPIEDGKETEESQEPEKKLTGKQLASRKRAIKYHEQLEKDKQLSDIKKMRESHKRTMKKTTKTGQPKLGSQIGVLLDKIKKNQ